MKSNVFSKEGDLAKNIFVTDGKLNVRLILERFIQTYHEVCGPLEDQFKEKDGREQFLLYLKPIINGIGTQTNLANEIGVATNTISIWELGERLPRNKYIEILADLLDTSITYLMGVLDDQKHPQVMSDEDAAAIADVEEMEIHEHMMELYRDLSIEMQNVVRITISSIWRAERDCGRLRSQQKD